MTPPPTTLWSSPGHTIMCQPSPWDRSPQLWRSPRIDRRGLGGLLRLSGGWRVRRRGQDGCAARWHRFGSSGGSATTACWRSRSSRLPSRLWRAREHAGRDHCAHTRAPAPDAATRVRRDDRRPSSVWRGRHRVGVQPQSIRFRSSSPKKSRTCRRPPDQAFALSCSRSRSRCGSPARCGTRSGRADLWSAPLRRPRQPAVADAAGSW